MRATVLPGFYFWGGGARSRREVPGFARDVRCLDSRGYFAWIREVILPGFVRLFCFSRALGHANPFFVFHEGTPILFLLGWACPRAREKQNNLTNPGKVTSRIQAKLPLYERASESRQSNPFTSERANPGKITPYERANPGNICPSLMSVLDVRP